MRKPDRLVALERSRWDDRLDGDSATGKLDALFEGAKRELAQGGAGEWPPSE